MTQIRLNKYLASIGIASRRKIDEITFQHRITINGRMAIPGDKVNPETDTVIVDKKIIKPQPQKLVYYALNKPKYILSSNSDDRGRETVLKFMPKEIRVFPVGRLDFESTGLILLTNDGDLALRITHPRYHLPKVYEVTVIGKISPDKIKNIKAAPADVEILPAKFNQGKLKITLYQGKKRQIRLLCAANHLHVVDLHRVSIGPINLGSLAPGQYRELTSAEIKSIQA